MFFGSPEHLTFLRYKLLSPQRRIVISVFACEGEHLHGSFPVIFHTCMPYLLIYFFKQVKI